MMRAIARRLHHLLGPVVEALGRYVNGARPDRPVQTFRYEKPTDVMQGGKEFVLLGRTDYIRGAVHVVRAGSAEHLHSHDTIDGFWLVLRGTARFHGDGEVYGEFGPMEGIVTPRRSRYWFESADGGDVEILQVLAFDPDRGWHRENHARPNFSAASVRKYDGRAGNRPY